MAINRQLSDVLPEVLSDHLGKCWEAYTEAAHEANLPIPRRPDFTTSLLRVWACSEFVAQACIRDPSLLSGLLASGDLLSDYRADEQRQKLEQGLAAVSDEQSLMRVLRENRLREMVRIAWRDLAGWAPLGEVLGDLSALADATINGALGLLGKWALQQPGVPKKLSPALVVLGMGKLGAHELNFSSDIDLIFAYPDEPARWRRARYSAEEFYSQLGQKLIQVLDDHTEHGFVFRVDMRLRPYGDSGPLVANFDAMAEYYQSQGREWERYAMIKARPVAGPQGPATRLMTMLRPFVYRRYLDFGAVESLRNLKEQIVREVERKGMQDNIKLGPGGIREIEFIAQAFQLVRGGRQSSLRQRGVLEVLGALAVLGYLPAHVTLQLAEAYVFLRRTENRLQAWEDQQVHELPEDDTGRIRLAFSMGFSDRDLFEETLARHRQLVQEHFEQVFASSQESVQDRRAQNTSDLKAVWQGTLRGDAAVKELRHTGFRHAEDVLQWLDSFRDGPVTRFLGDQGQQRLDELMPLLLTAVATEKQAMQTLSRLGELLEAIAGRTTYLSLLVEHPMALSQLIQLCAASAWIADLLAQHPLLLDELLDPRSLYAPLDKAGLQSVLTAQLSAIEGDDLEQQMDSLRQFKQASVLHVAASDIVTDFPVERVGDYLTYIAEVALEHTLQLAWKKLVSRHGRPFYVALGKKREAGFAIAAYGKLGGAELGYGSDLDIVFLHDSHGENQQTSGPKVIDNHEFYTRLSQRIIHILNTYTSAGILYEVDTRLRPNGSSGLLVSSFEAFAEYQRRSAWTWENQAMVRARVVAGDAELARQFERVRAGVLARPRNPGKLRKDVIEMRERMRQELDKSTRDTADLKHGRGGIVDVEFMVQWGALSWSASHTELLGYTHNNGLLQA
ncbi:MAG: bifunctional [glutamate--ammonia ligase]-adenylyl-L-tyrosine phosphorylase/[glutamate--ammonia-ligase] adenylyltransferase, partial [Gammaproteobacteria bacterium]